MSVKVKWYDDQFERQELDPKVDKFLNRLGARGEAIAKQLITGLIMPDLRAVDEGFLRASLSFVVGKVGRKAAVRIGTYIARTDGKPLKYAVYVFLGTHKMPARPILRTMLRLLKVELR